MILLRIGMKYFSVFRIIGITFIFNLTGCVSTQFYAGKTETILPLNTAWVDGQKVEYVTTDISDLSMAKAAGVNYVPRLANAITSTASRSILERVYKFANGEQISIFQSAPKPAGGFNQDRNYSPLWRLAIVKWLNPHNLRELKSEAELLDAEDGMELSIEITNIVVNCPVTKGVDGSRLKGSR